MTVTFKEYEEQKINFIKKHNNISCCEIHTSAMVDDSYHKEYCWGHGANWFEKTDRITEIHEIEAHGMTFKTEITMWRTEFWSTESGSKFVYEK